MAGPRSKTHKGSDAVSPAPVPRLRHDISLDVLCMSADLNVYTGLKAATPPDRAPRMSGIYSTVPVRMGPSPSKRPPAPVPSSYPNEMLERAAHVYLAPALRDPSLIPDKKSPRGTKAKVRFGCPEGGREGWGDLGRDLEGPCGIWHIHRCLTPYQSRAATGRHWGTAAREGGREGGRAGDDYHNELCGLFARARHGYRANPNYLWK